MRVKLHWSPAAKNPWTHLPLHFINGAPAKTTTSQNEKARVQLRELKSPVTLAITMVDPCVPVIADADTGVAMCACTTTMCARTGVAGLLIEDPVKQKRLVPLDEYLVRIHAALGSKIILITRSDALAPFGLRLSRTCGPVPDVVTSPTPSLTEQCGMQRRGQSSLTRTYRARSRSPNEYLVGALPTSLPPGAVLRKHAARRGLTAFPSFVESSETYWPFPLGNAYTPPSATHRTHPRGPVRSDVPITQSARDGGLHWHHIALSGGTTSQTQMQLPPARVLWGERKADVQAGRWRDDSCSPAIDGGCFE
ncbi:hypothetical protein B0H10DRAFT_2213740 [Mycena sp. CBHHK59/15]|nr:hypothetical protein B0H10DRAFT_2213740 [Mycena sp. CBHHK59/15]